MKTVRNKSHKPLRVHLARGKVLHLGPRMEGQIATHDADRESVRKLVEAGELEILGEGEGAAGGERESGSVHADPHGHHPNLTVKKRGDR